MFLNGSVSFSLLLCVKDVLWFLCLSFTDANRSYDSVVVLRVVAVTW